MGRNLSEAAYFRRSNFESLAQDCVGIDSLRTRLSRSLFDHVKKELPQLREDLDEASKVCKNQVEVMASRERHQNNVGIT